VARAVLPCCSVLACGDPSSERCSHRIGSVKARPALPAILFCAPGHLPVHPLQKLGTSFALCTNHGVTVMSAHSCSCWCSVWSQRLSAQVPGAPEGAGGAGSSPGCRGNRHNRRWPVGSLQQHRCTPPAAICWRPADTGSAADLPAQAGAH